MMVHFDDIFDSRDNVLKPKVTMCLNGILMTPTEFPRLEEINLHGVPLQQLADTLLEVDALHNGITVFTIHGKIDDFPR